MLNIVDFNNRIASRLGDTDKVYNTNTQINGIIKEALLTFGAISGYWKSLLLIESTSSASVVDKQIYNILIEADVKTGYEYVEGTLTYQDVINWIDADLIGYSSIVSTNSLIEAITDAINTFQSKTKLVLGRKTFAVDVSAKTIVDDDVLDIVAAFFIDDENNYTPLERIDEDKIALIDANVILTPSKPKYYAINNLSLSIVDIFPPPNVNGTLEVIYVQGKSGVQTVASNCLIPDNLVPYIKYKVLMDAFDNDTDKDSFRAAYCKTRWQEGLTIGQNYAAIIRIRLNDIIKPASSLKDFNWLRYGWRMDEETSTKKINSVALAGYNILALNRIPINVYSILLDVISNAPISEEDIDLRDDYVPSLLEYCLHLASIKDGIAAIQKTIAGLENFIKLAVKHNIYLQMRKVSYIDLIQKSKYPIKQVNLIEQEEDAA